MGGGENSDMHKTCIKTWFIHLSENSSLRHMQNEYDYAKWEKVQKSWTALKRLNSLFGPENKMFVVLEPLVNSRPYYGFTAGWGTWGWNVE